MASICSAEGGRSDLTTVPWTVTYLYGNSSHWTERLSTPAVSISPPLRDLRPCEERNTSDHLVPVPDRRGVRRPVVASSNAQHPDARLGEELLALLLGHPTGHASSSKVGFLILQWMVGSRALIHKCLPSGSRPTCQKGQK
jgi:hypothetical protein